MNDLNNNNRLLLKVELEPVQGKRFQPTGFPDLGAAEMQLSEGTRSLLVESAQSMANRLELVCLNKDRDGFVDPLNGLTMIKVENKDGKQITNSVSESHRICSYYIIDKDTEITKELEALEEKFSNGVDIKETAKLLFRLDINSLLHGIWASQIKSGRIKIPRALSAFIEADNVNDAISGGVKFDNVNPSSKDKEDGSKKDEDGGSIKGQGHIPFSRIEYTSDSIHAYFNLDLEQIKNYGLNEDQTELLTNLALWKIRAFLETGLRLRTACDLKIKGDIQVTEPKDYTLPDKTTLDSKIKELIQKCRKDLPEPVIVAYKK